MNNYKKRGGGGEGLFDWTSLKNICIQVMCVYMYEWYGIFN